MAEDRNFDDLAEQFEQRIYQSSKGHIRLAVLTRDCQQWLPHLYKSDCSETDCWQILDAGGGEGVFACSLAQQGHHITLCDQSQQMLVRAQKLVEDKNLGANFSFIHSTIQALKPSEPLYDMVLCHAVLEWVQEPHSLLTRLISKLKPGGYLSLMFFNQHSTVFRSLVRGYFERAKNNSIKGSGKGLTPINPLLPDEVLSWFEPLGLNVLCHSGVRVFHDYMHYDIRRNREEVDITQLELQYSQLEPYRSLGRYIHVIAQRV